MQRRLFALPGASQGRHAGRVIQAANTAACVGDTVLTELGITPAMLPTLVADAQAEAEQIRRVVAGRLARRPSS